MKKAKAKSKAAPKKAAKKSSSKIKEQVDLEEVRKDISNIVGTEAAVMVKAVVEQAKLGQLAPVKYLLEAAGVYPASAESGEGKPEQDSLARTLLRRLGLPEYPVVPEEEEAPVLLRKKAEPEKGETAEQQSGNEQESGAENSTAANVEQVDAADMGEANDHVE